MDITKEQLTVSMPLKYRIINTDRYSKLQVLGENNMWLNGMAFVRNKDEYSDITPINQYFGENAVNFYQQLGMLGHNGIDWNAPSKSCLYAVCNGTVISVVTDKTDKGYGQNVDYLSDEIIIGNKKYRFEIIEGHLSKEYVEVNQRILKGDKIGLTGNTGKYTTGAHLHEGFRLLQPVSQLRGNYTTHWYLAGWGYQNNGYLGYIDHLSLIDNYEVMNKALEKYEGKYIQLTEAPGGFYKVENGELVTLSSEKDPITRHIPLVDEIIRIMNKQKLVVGLNKEQIDNLL